MAEQGDGGNGRAGLSGAFCGAGSAGKAVWEWLAFLFSENRSCSVVVKFLATGLLHKSLEGQVSKMRGRQQSTMIPEVIAEYGLFAPTGA